MSDTGSKYNWHMAMQGEGFLYLLHIGYPDLLRVVGVHVVNKIELTFTCFLQIIYHIN